MSTELIETRALEAFYGDAQALFGIDFTLHAGEVVAIIGANGAGKSTLLKALTGLVPVKHESVRWRGTPIGGDAPGDIVRRGLALVPEGRRLFASLSVEENLLMGSFAGRAGPWSLQRLYAMFPVLREKRQMPGTSLSGGQQQMVAIGRALLNENRILLVDEPTKGLAPLLVTEVARVLERVSETETMLLVEQNLGVVKRIARDAIVLDGGRVTYAGPAEELLSDPARVRSLLGVSGAGGH